MRKPSLYLLSALLLVILLYDTKCSAQIKWMTRAPLPNLLTECASAVLNGKIYIIGGLEPGGVSTTTVHVYDPVQNSWSSASPLPIAMHHMACAVANGKIYVLGGYVSNPFEPVSNTYEYDPNLNQWTPKASVPSIRGASAAAEFQGKIYVTGGAGFNLLQSTDINEVYNPATNMWETKAPMPTSRDHHAVATLDTLIYSIGGRNFSINMGSTTVVEAYSPNSNKWYQMDSLLWRRSGFSLCAAGGKIFAVGGEWFAPGQNGLAAQIEFYDPAVNSWQFLTTMQTTRHGLGIGVVGDTVYTISGGVQPGFSYSDVNEAFVPGSSIGIQQISEKAEEFSLSQNYPNPFNPATSISFKIPEDNFVTLKIYDVTGREVMTIISNNLKRGSYTFSLNNQNLSSGVYIYSLSAGESRLNKKMVVVK